MSDDRVSLARLALGVINDSGLSPRSDSAVGFIVADRIAQEILTRWRLVPVDGFCSCYPFDGYARDCGIAEHRLSANATR